MLHRLPVRKSLFLQHNNYNYKYVTACKTQCLVLGRSSVFQALLLNMRLFIDSKFISLHVIQTTLKENKNELRLRQLLNHFSSSSLCVKLNGLHHKHNFPTYYVDIKSCTKTKSDSAIFFLKLYVITPATVSVLVWFVFVFVCVFSCLISFCKHSIQKNSSARCRKNRCFNNSKSSCKFHNWCSVYGRISCKKI